MKKLFCVLTVVCVLAMLIAVGSMTASATEFNGDKSKITPELLSAIEQSGEGDTLSVWLWYEDVTDMQQVTSEIAARVAEALADKVSIPYDDIGNILDKAGLSDLKEGALAKIESILTENADRSNEWKITEVNIMTERYLSSTSTEKKADTLIASLGIKEEQILFKSIFSPSMIVNATVSEIEKFTENDTVMTVDLYTESEVIEPTATATNVEPTLYGDANDDGVVNMKDVLAVRKYVAEMETALDFTAADINRDEAVNMKDVLAVRQIVAYGNLYSEQNPLDYGLERVAEIGSSDSIFENFPQAAILRSPADVEALFAKSSHYNFSTGTSAPIYPKNTYDDAFFAEKFLVALRVDNGDIDDENPVSGVFQGESGSLVIHTNNDWQCSPWTEQDVLLISLSLEKLEGLCTVYEIRRTPKVDFFTGKEIGCEYSLKGKYAV